MKVANINNINNKRSKPTFTSIYTNKIMKNTFKFAEENGTLFVATTSLVLSSVVRPLVILSTPKTDKETKQYAASKSIASSLTGFMMMFMASVPLSRAIKKIDAKPTKYLKSETIKNLKDSNSNLKNSKPYICATQLFKLGTGLIIAAPKAMLTCLLIPPVLAKIFPQKKQKCPPSFKGKQQTNYLSKLIGKIIDIPKVQQFANKIKNKNYELAIISATDIVATAGFIHQNKKNKNMSEKNKKTLNYNVIFGTLMSITSAFALDKLLEKKTNKFIEKFKNHNTNLENMEKYVEGIKITKKVFLLGGIYYGVIPLFSTFLSDKAGKKH